MDNVLIVMSDMMLCLAGFQMLVGWYMIPKTRGYVQMTTSIDALVFSYNS